MNKDVSPVKKQETGLEPAGDVSSRTPLDNSPGQPPEPKFDFVKMRNRFWIAIISSILLHMTLGGGLALAPSKIFTKPKSKTTVELLSPDELKAMIAAQAEKAKHDNLAKQIVETDKTRLNDEVDPKAKYLSQYDQRVEKETRAAQSGKFTNDAGQGQQQQAAAPTRVTEADPSDTENAETETMETAGTDSDIATHEFGDLAIAAPKGQQRNLQKFNPSFRKLPTVPDPTSEQSVSGDGREVSKTDDHLKNVPTGMQTMLSTREFVYYSYYNRIKDKLRQHWEPAIKAKFERTIRQGRNIASEGDKITKVVIVLDGRGTLIRVQVVSASGVVDLDEAAVEAFRAAAPFPNPPKGIVEEDGTIKIRWDFVLEA